MMVHWEDKDKWPPEQEAERLRMIERAKKHRDFIKNVLQPIKDRLDLFGERSLSAGERVIVDQRRAFFFPEETRRLAKEG